MSLRAAILSAVLVAGGLVPIHVLACGDSEAGLSCDDSGTGAEAGAKWMLSRATKAVTADKEKAFEAFSKGMDGFRTADTYVFCVGPDGTMTAHPNPILRGHDARDLHDKTGNYFIRAMMQEAKTGQISVIRYLFSKPGSTLEEPKTTYYTKSGDQTCAVGVYDTDVTAPQATTPEARVASLRAKLDRQIPASVREDWNAFLEALNQAGDAQAAAIVRARDGLKAAQAALAPNEQKAAAERE